MTDQVARAALERALDEKDLLIIYQPIFDIRNDTLYAAEALLRQVRQSGEIREAGIITDAAEEGPELFELTHWTVRQSFADAREWRDVRLNVNLSPREFQEGDVFERVTSAIGDCGIDTNRINLEITETSYIDKPKETMHVVEEIKRLGISLWLDDFGTGHSSIEHLQLFPLDGIKLPGKFVGPMVKDERCRKITRALVALAHDLGLEVIAEGVEHQQQLDMLREWGCEYVQGFLLARPMTLEQFEELMATRA